MPRVAPDQPMHPKRLEALERQLQEAVRFESGAVDRARRDLGTLEWLVVPERASAPPTVLAVVAADGGNIELRLRPFRVSFVRVASSDPDIDGPIGEAFFPHGLPASELALMLEREIPSCIDPLVAANVDINRIVEAACRNPNPVNGIREMLEWGALLAALAVRRTVPYLVIRDGLLRSVAINADDFEQIGHAVQQACARTGNRLAAVAKSLPGGMDMLNLLLSTGVFARRPTQAHLAALRVSPEVERAVLPRSYTERRSLGALVLVARRGVPMLTPIEVLDPSDEAVIDVVRALHDDALAYWPTPGQPVELAVAHDRAHVTAFEHDLLRRVFLHAVADVDPKLARTVLAAGVLGAGGVMTEGAT